MTFNCTIFRFSSKSLYRVNIKLCNSLKECCQLLIFNFYYVSNIEYNNLVWERRNVFWRFRCSSNSKSYCMSAANHVLSIKYFYMLVHVSIFKSLARQLKFRYKTEPTKLYIFEDIGIFLRNFPTWKVVGDWLHKVTNTLDLTFNFG